MKIAVIAFASKADQRTDEADKGGTRGRALPKAVLLQSGRRQIQQPTIMLKLVTQNTHIEVGGRE